MQYLQVCKRQTLRRVHNDLQDICSRADEKLIAKHGKSKAFLSGGNSSCRYHLRQHYELYKARCKEANVPEHHWAIPRPIWKRMQAQKCGKKVETQVNLDGIIQKVKGPQEFTREGLRHAITKFVACDDQVSDPMIQSYGDYSLSSPSPLLWQIKQCSATAWSL